MSLRKMMTCTLVLLFVLAMVPCLASAQSLTQGNVIGTVTDPSGAVVPGATVTLKSTTTGQTFTRTTNGQGFYEFALVPPGPYTVSISAPSYQPSSNNVQVAVGRVTSNNAQLVVAASQQTVEVTAEGSVLTTTPGVATTMSQEQIALVPNGGGDLSYIAQTAPGSTMNTQAGFGNFSAFGIPAIMNNFTVNSMPENDPFLSLNNSGATNILLGSNDIQEANVVSTSYSGQYSQAGANVNYVSKAGTNRFHGDASWKWNGTSMNANGFFNKQNTPATPRGFVNANQWAASFGGPIKKDKTFFFVNTEGLRLIIPVSRTVNLPTLPFQQAVLSSVAGKSPIEVPFYQTMFNIYNGAPGAAAAANTLPDGGCADLVGATGGISLPGFQQFSAANPCAVRLNSTVKGATHEWLITGRLDHNFSEADKLFGHFKMDKGLQATYTDPLNPIFNVTSDQPQYEGQLQWTHSAGASIVNSFSVNGSYYRAIFVQPQLQQALQLQPMQVQFSGNSLFSVGRNYSFPSGFPQGRNVTQYGFVDDFSWTLGPHTVKIGANLARYDITDYDPGIGSLPAVPSETLTDFANGVATNFTQSFPSRLTQPVALYNLGFYGEDTWRARKNLSLTFTLRTDYFSNPVCQTDCFNRFANNFGNILHGPNVPYNLNILANQHQALPDSYHPWNLQPRFGFSWQPFGASTNTVFSGGFGLFSSSNPAGGYADSLMNNLPGDPTFTLAGVPLGVTAPGNGPATAAVAANALRTGFFNGATLNSLVATVPGFSAPSFFNAAQDIHSPRFQEWNLQVEQGFGTKTALSLKYVGNHGIWQQIQNNGLNAFCNSVTDSTLTVSPADSCLAGLGAPAGVTAFNGLPLLPTDPRFLQITEASSGYTSNYHGLTASLLRRISALQFQLNYTWSHALDFASNNGQAAEPFNANTNLSVSSPQNPFNVRQNMYGNADYDVRHYFSANYVYTTPRTKGLLGALSDWTVSGTFFVHTGTPFTVVDTGTGGVLNGFGYGGSTIGITTFANQIGGAGSLTCNRDSAFTNKPTCPDLANNFVSNPIGFGNQRRNQVYGPSYFNTDLSVKKNFHLPGTEAGAITLGVNFFNILNHANFDQPTQDVADPNFGRIVSTVNSPTSIYGSFLNADAAPRLIQTEIKLTF
jgi:hypothetical protein